jgi:hypothetical protein
MYYYLRFIRKSIVRQDGARLTRIAHPIGPMVRSPLHPRSEIQSKLSKQGVKCCGG